MNIFVLGFYHPHLNFCYEMNQRLKYTHVVAKTGIVPKKNALVEGIMHPRDFIKVFDPHRDAVVLLYDYELAKQQDLTGFDWNAYNTIKQYLQFLQHTKAIGPNRVVWLQVMGAVNNMIDTTMKSLKRSVCALLKDEKTGLYLGVSRKHDHNDFGLPGGKVEVEVDETDEQAVVREVKEETGLDIENLKPVFGEFVKGNKVYYCTTFTGDYSGVINTKEKGVVKWITKQKLLDGSFGDYNRRLFKSLKIPV